MALLPDRARQRNNFHIIRLARPRIERERDAEGWLVLLPGGSWLCGDRRQALAEFSSLVEIEVEGRAMTVVRFPREYREPPPPEREQLELWPELPPLGLDQRQEVSQLLAGTTDEVGAAFAHLRVCDIAGAWGHLCAARRYLAWLDDIVCEDEQ